MTKKTFLTERDQEFLEDLHDMVFLDLEYAKKKVYRTTGENAIARRLKKIADNGYITVQKLPLMGKNASGRTKNIYTLNKRGAEEVNEIVGEMPWDSRWVNMDNKSPSHVHHQTMMSMVRAAFQLNEGGMHRFYTWLNERRSFWQFSDNSGDVIRPDGSMILQNKETKNYGYFTFELERSRQRPEVSIKKMQRYNRYSKEQAWKKQHVFGVDLQIPPRVIWVSNQTNEMLNLFRHTKDVNTDYTSGVLYTTYDQITENPYGKIFLAKDAKDPEKLHSISDPIEKE